MSTTDLPSLADPAVQLCPFAAYSRLRDEAPVFRDPVTRHWIVTRFEDVKAIASDWERFSNANNEFEAGRQGAPGQDAIRKLYEEHDYVPVRTLIGTDPPIHRWHRAAVNTAFSTPRVRAMDSYIEQMVNEAIDRFAAKGETDFVAEFAIPLPMSVIADQLGVPRDMSDTFKRWSDAMMTAANVGNPPDVQLDAARTILEMREFLLAEIRKLYVTPRDCILSDIASAVGEDGALLPEPERLTIASQILVAGNETTTSTLGHAMLRMISSPGLEDKLRAEPSLIPPFVEECLRLDAPLQGLVRRATQDVELHGMTIRANDIVLLRWGAANRDERRFACPDTLDLSRADPRGHMTFGHGIHFCPGRELARAEVKIAFQQLLKRLKNFRLAEGDDNVQFQPSYIAYGPSRVHIRFDAA